MTKPMNIQIDREPFRPVQQRLWRTVSYPVERRVYDACVSFWIDDFEPNCMKLLIERAINDFGRSISWWELDDQKLLRR